MNRIATSFKNYFKDKDLEALEQSQDTIFVLSRKLEFLYFNKAWFLFAANNNGEPFISNKVLIGSNFENFVLGDLRNFYLEKYKMVLEKNEKWTHLYECSSKNEFRIFQQNVIPLKNGFGLLVTNSLIKENTIENKKDNNITLKSFLDEYGNYNQCSNCRKTKKTDENLWVWIPEIIDTKIENISHTICPICFELYWK